MSPVEYHNILVYHLMIPPFSIYEVWSVCRKAYLDQYGEYVVHCKELAGVKHRHDLVKDVL
jgi:heme/copper-type cytochrome/quinol oxidase subunit 2